MRRTLPLLILFLLFGGVLFLFYRASRPPETDAPQESGSTNPLPAARAAPQITFLDPIRGPREAVITIVEFGDYFCEFCRSLEPVTAEVLAKYPEKVRLVWKDFPNDFLHPNASRAASAALCAGEQNKFWEFHDLLFARAASSLLLDFSSLAAELGLNQTAFSDCLSSERLLPRLAKNIEEAQALNLSGVPFFFINNEPFEGTTVEEFVRVIEEKLK
ncbi:thioredoxin domain-containing protein [Candidatus Uhrbacteria bacterium]|nr:thioredoxin domain-containing protein [Candidatus Uhrbacteria bacterium]